MVGIDVSQLYFDQILDHFFSFVERFQQQVLHYLKNTFGKLFVSLNLLYFYRINHSPQLLMDQMGAL